MNFLKRIIFGAQFGDSTENDNVTDLNSSNEIDYGSNEIYYDAVTDLETDTLQSKLHF